MTDLSETIYDYEIDGAAERGVEIDDRPTVVECPGCGTTRPTDEVAGGDAYCDSFCRDADAAHDGEPADDSIELLFRQVDDDGSVECSICFALDSCDVDEVPSILGSGYESSVRCTACGSAEEVNPFTGESKIVRGPGAPVVGAEEAEVDTDVELLLRELVVAAIDGKADEFSELAAELAAHLLSGGSAPTVWPVR